MVRCEHIGNLNQLINRISTGNFDCETRGPVVVKIILWDKRMITGSYYVGDKKPEVTNEHNITIIDDKFIQFIERLLAKGESFITETTSHGIICPLIWEMKKEQ